MTLDRAAVTRALCCLAALLAVDACGTTAPSRFYTLSSVPPQLASEAPGGTAPSGARNARLVNMLVGTIELPQTMDRPQFVRRSGANTVELAELDRWAEPLDGMARRSLADDLTARLPRYRVLTSSLPSVPIDRTLMLEIDGFDADAAGIVKLNAQWFVLADGATTPLLSRRAAIEEPAGANDTEAIVVAMSKALARLADEVARALSELPAGASK